MRRKNRRHANGRENGPGYPYQPGPARHPPAPEEIIPGKDYTREILEFLLNAHGKIRVDGGGDHFYEGVSTLSLHFLLRSRLPAREMLWRWYEYFDKGRSETIYQTLPPQRDEEFLEILSTCSFEWDPEAVRQSGLVFLPTHRREVYLALEESLATRLDVYETMSDAELAEILTPKGTWSDRHLRKLVRAIQTRPPSRAEREAIYSQFESDYLKATARHLIDEALSETFWKSPPPDLESLRSRFIIFARTMANTARRLGVYTTRATHEQREGSRNSNGNGFRAGGNRLGKAGKIRNLEAEYFTTLGLTPTATLPQVKTAYRDMVKQHHPDQGGSVQEFLRLQEAYEYLLTQVF